LDLEDRMPMNTAPTGLARNVVDLFGDVGVAWLERLPSTIAECEERWCLVALPPLDGASYNYVAPAIRADGAEVMLKIGVPSPELVTEIEALLFYDGRGSVFLLAADRSRGALLLEWLRLGASLWSVRDDEEATRIAARVMRQLWPPAPPGHSFPTVKRWAAGLARMRGHFDGTTGPLPRALVQKAEGLFAELLDTMEDAVLLHGDLHQGNILSAQRQPWLAIDPKGIVGEPAYEVGALLRNISTRQLEQSQPRRLVARRADILAEELGFDRTRLLGWGLAQAVLAAWWCIEDHGEGWERFIRCAKLIDEAMGWETRYFGLRTEVRWENVAL
jgi:streptomycin 6-kinase